MSQNQAHDTMSDNNQDSADSANANENSEQLSARHQLKRRRGDGPQYARRKRAATACGFCRQRKTKCDNVRPVCGFCRLQRARCIYEDENITEKQTTHDESSQEIIDRLEEIRLLLQDKPSMPVQQTSQIGSESASPSFSTSNTANRAIEDSPSTSLSTFDALRCESLLRWPIFNNLVTEEEKQVVSFVLESASEQNKDDSSMTSSDETRTDQSRRDGRLIDPGRSKKGRGVEDDEFVPLCRKFLVYVHPRNPILEPDELIKYARKAGEQGLTWDSASCLVVSYLEPRSIRHAYEGNQSYSLAL